MSKLFSSSGSFRLVWENLSLGTRLLIIIAIISSTLILLIPVQKNSGTEIWIFSRNHKQLYDPMLVDWNKAHPDRPAFLSLIDNQALGRRLQSAFFSGTPAADLVEMERNTIPTFFAGPLEEIGFLDLTDRIKAEGLDQIIVPASFSTWTSRGRIFGLPHDVHPVLMAYRHDLTEAAGIDLSKVETWDDFFKAMKPLQADKNGDGQPDRFILSFSILESGKIEAFMMQAGGGLFNEQEKPTLDSPVNAKVLSHVVTWCEGPNRVTAEANEFSASGNRLKIDGFVVASIMPDWLCATWKMDLPQLSGKIRVIPLPAWEPGGCRTSSMGGSMMGIPKTAADLEKSWEMIKYFYLSPKIAEDLYRTNDIITPVSSHWSNPIYDQPDPYFNGQAKGRLYINQAMNVPRRTSSPFYQTAQAEVGQAALKLQAYARQNNQYDPAQLEPVALRFLEQAQAEVKTRMKRNVFIAPE